MTTLPHLLSNREVFLFATLPVVTEPHKLEKLDSGACSERQGSYRMTTTATTTTTREED